MRQCSQCGQFESGRIFPCKNGMPHNWKAPRKSGMEPYPGAPAGQGPTGRFPAGQVTPDDQGELQIAMAFDPTNGLVIIDFGAPVAWVGMEFEQAEFIAQSLLKKAKEAREYFGRSN